MVLQVSCEFSQNQIEPRTTQRNDFECHKLCWLVCFGSQGKLTLILAATDNNTMKYFPLRRNISDSSVSSRSSVDMGRIKKMQLLLFVLSLSVFIAIQRDVMMFQDDLKRNETQYNKPPKQPNSTRSPQVAPTVSQNSPTSKPVSTTPNPTTLAPTTIQERPKTGTLPPTMAPTTRNLRTNQPTVTPHFKPSRSPPTSSPYNYPIQQPGANKNSSADFAEQFCDLDHVSSWYPDGESFKAPHVILAGVMNSGTNTLAQRLYTHPQISKQLTKTHGFFLPRNFDKYTYQDKTKVFAARERMYSQNYNNGLLESSPNTIAMDVSPGYLFHAQRVSQSILCVSPWAKIIIVLKNPVDRVYEQWVEAKEKAGLRISLEQWIANEKKLLDNSGLDEAEPGSLREREAWKQYQKVRGSTNPLGRSIYVLQFEEWLEMYKKAGKDPTKEIKIIPSEVLEDETKYPTEHEKILEFLGLPYQAWNTTRFLRTASSKSPSMDENTRELLESFFKPYNKRLYKLLAKESFPNYEWKKLWKHQTN